MSEFNYQDIRPMTRTEVESALASADPRTVREALVAMANHEDDWNWAQEQCLLRLRHSDGSIRAIAALCLGHLARNHGRIDRKRVIPALEALKDDPDAAGQASDALDDIELFVRR